MEYNISVCIVGHDQADLLGECIDGCLEVSRRTVYVDLGSTDDSITVAEQRGVAVVRGGPSPAETHREVRRAAGEGWTLFVRPDERPVLKPGGNLEAVLNKDSLQGCGLIVRDAVGPEVLEGYQWMKVTEQYTSIGDSSYVPRIELRLGRHPHLTDILEALTAGSQKDLSSLPHAVVTEIEIHPCRSGAGEEKQESCTGERERGLKRLRGEVPAGPVEEDELFELDDNSLIYSVLTMRDLAVYHQGLSMGVGGERMYLFMLDYLVKFGRYHEAKEFFERWKKKWGIFDTLEPYKIGGIIYASLLELEAAALCLEKYVASAPPDKALGEALSALAKVSLLQGRRDEALSLFRRAQGCSPKEDFRPIMQIVEGEGWRPARLSVCMIARDEEQIIRRALESIAPVAEEIVVVDTGSADDTKKIAGEFTDIVIDAPWEDDFSRARNRALDRVTGDYVLFLDADEFIDARELINVALFKQIMPPQRDKAYQIRVESEDEDEEIAVMLRLPKMEGGEYQVRLFPANKGIAFSGTAHESVDESIRDTEIIIQQNDQFRIMHAKVDPGRRARRKMNAVRASFDSACEPARALKGFLYFLKLGEPDTAAAWLEKAGIDDPRLLAKIADYYVSSGAVPATIPNLVREGLKRFPDSTELILSHAEIALAEGRYDDICEMPPPLEAIKARGNRADCARASYLYGMALSKTGRVEEGIGHLGDARNEDPWNVRYRVGAIYVLVLCGKWEKALDSVIALSRDEGIDLRLTISDFADVGVVFGELGLHFLDRNLGEAAALCNEVLELIIQTKIADSREVEKVNRWLDRTGSALKEIING